MLINWAYGFGYCDMFNQLLRVLVISIPFASSIIGCTRNNDALPIGLDHKSIDEKSAAVQDATASLESQVKMSGLEFDGTGVARTQAIYDGSVPVLIEAIVTANSAKGEQAIVSNCQVSGFSLSIKDGQWIFYWHDGVKYKSVSAPATLGKQTHLLGIVENSRMELRIDGVSQGMTSADGHRESKLPFYIAADPKLDPDEYKYDPKGSEFPFTGVIYECRISSDPNDIERAKLGDTGSKSERAFLHYVFDEGGDKVIDRSMHKNDATIENGKWLPAVSN